MKRIINTFGLVFLAAFIMVSVQSCSGTAEKETIIKTATEEVQTASEEVQTASEEVQTASGVKAYYFHATRRCATCQAVESVTSEALKEYYGDSVNLESIDKDEDKDNPLLTKYEISGQTLLILKGDEVVDLTSQAFLNARTNPDKLKATIKLTIDSMI